MALEKNQTWVIMNVPPGKKVETCKLVFTVKHKEDGSVEKLKARLAVRGFTQSYGIDYQENFVLVAKLSTIRILLSLAANLDWPLHQLDIKNAFLNGNIKEEVYIEIPMGIQKFYGGDKVCKMLKSLYGLK
ncbi:Retrovirus-related Pol polyprotein from transposon TNT 1-94 [Dendrobium catenatum]|uniref:Retrovirus-related Pol polyprotein from transposon TNT 1-94 n=1 Tax=Dendrobium catenatum TaxID=906689 RepID=A0A2I0WAU9_9ASPA|nr:Retrovirus-related Pol polyprotein from transposon TNT 1-94 [Dendrobium catenatum]